MPSVDTLPTYHLPEGATLASSKSVELADVAKRLDLSDTMELAKQLGYERIESRPERLGHWEVYQRFNHYIPNFPDGETMTHSMVAFYDGIRSAQTAVLGTVTQSAPFNPAYFADGLDRISRFYLERHDFIRFPLKNVELDVPERGLLAIVGGFEGFAISAFASHGDKLAPYLLLGGMVFAAGLPNLIVGVNRLRERRLKSHLGNWKELSIGVQVRDVLEAEDQYRAKVTIQKEVYQKIKEDNPEMDPKTFLDTVHAPLAQSPDYQRRMEEIMSLRIAEPDAESISPHHQKLVRAGLVFAS